MSSFQESALMTPIQDSSSIVSCVDSKLCLYFLINIDTYTPSDHLRAKSYEGRSIVEPDDSLLVVGITIPNASTSDIQLINQSEIEVF